MSLRYKKFILSILVFFFGTMAIAYPWHMWLFHAEYINMGAFTREQPIMPLGMTAVLMQAVIFSYFYPLYYRHKKGGTPIIRGMQFALVMGIIVYSVMVYATAAKFQIEPISEFLTLGTSFTILHFALVGALMGVVHGNRPLEY